MDKKLEQKLRLCSIFLEHEFSEVKPLWDSASVGLRKFLKKVSVVLHTCYTVC